MTKYILHGGNTSEDNKDNNSFFYEIANSVPKHGLLLLNYFSRDKNDVERCYKQDTNKIIKVSKRKDIKYEITDENILKEQLKKASGMYMRGGRTPQLQKKLLKTKNLENLFKKKTISGSSAGAYVLSRYYCGNTFNKNRKGLGILDIKLRVHYKEKDDKIVIPELLAYKEKYLPLVTLGDHKWIVMYK